MSPMIARQPAAAVCMRADDVASSSAKVGLLIRKCKARRLVSEAT